MRYVDGFVIVVPKKKMKAYMAMANKAGKIWMEYGALQYCESVGQDLKTKMGMPFTKMAKAGKNDNVVFSWIVYKSRKHRDEVNKKVMKDKRMQAMCPDPKDPPFDMKKFAYGGFEIAVDKD